MNYKGYNIAVHEMGHNVEQTFSLYDVDHTLLKGVPNTAFTEALAFVFQGRDLELLGLPAPDADEPGGALNDFWATYEIAGCRAGRHGGVALDVRASRGDAARNCARPRCRSRRRRVEPLLRAGLPQARCACCSASTRT